MPANDFCFFSFCSTLVAIHYNDFVDAGIVEQLVSLNREFYQSFSVSFSSTRYQVQPGVRKIAKRFPQNGNLLDMGCGNGNLTQVLQKNGFRGTYTGVDFSENLIQESQKAFVLLGTQATFQAHFSVFDLMSSDWQILPIREKWDVICAFAVFHHIPGKDNWKRIFHNIHSILNPKSDFVFSVWQPQNSKRLVKRYQPWSTIGLLDTEVEEGDVLMDWKAEQAQDTRIGLRYVHVFTRGELREIAQECGFSIKDEFYSDGKEGNIGLYQVWQTEPD